MKKLFFILLVTLFLYLLVINFSASFSNFDTQSYNVIGVLTLNGKSIYPDPALSRHPYLPLFLYFEAVTKMLSPIFHISQSAIIKIILTFFHLWSVYAIYLLSKKNIKTTFLYALNPISLLIIAFQGQFDIIPLSLILFSILLTQRKKYSIVMILLGLAVTLKTWPLLFIIPFLKRAPKKYWGWFFLLPVFSVLFYALLFHAPLFSIARVLAVYQGVGGIWGLGKLISFVSTQKIFLFSYKIVFVVSILFYSLKQKKGLIVEELLESFLLFFIFTPGFGIQWFIWLVPFLFLTKKPYMYLFITAITLGLAVAYSSWAPFKMVSPTVTNSVLFLVWPLFIIYYCLFYIVMKRD